MRLLFTIFTGILFSSCNSSNNILLFDVMNHWDVKDLNTNYFIMDSSNYSDTLMEKEASKFLYRSKEPILYKYFGEEECIRLTWIRAFENPIVMRVCTWNEQSYLRIKEGNKYKSTKNVVLLDTTILIPYHILQEMRKQLLQSDFRQAHYASNNYNKDGATWFLEYKNPTFYKAIKRWDDAYCTSPDFKKYASSFISLTNGLIQLKTSR